MTRPVAVLLIAGAVGVGLMILFWTVDVASLGRVLVCAVADVQGDACAD